MRNFRSFLVSWVIITSSLVANTAASPPGPRIPLSLGTVDDQPVVFTAEMPGLVAMLTDIKYDGFGRIADYTIELTRGKSKSTVQVHASSKGGGTPTYEATSGNVRLKAANDSSASSLGFMPAEAGGVAARAGLTVKSELAYDDFGRRQVAKQSFRDAGKSIEVVFSGYERDGFGRLTSYRAEVRESH